MFKSLNVAKECVSDDQWYSRQAQEKYLGAISHANRAAVLAAELTAFLEGRLQVAAGRIPDQGRGFDG